MMNNIEEFIKSLESELESGKEVGIENKTLTEAYNYLVFLYQGHKTDISKLINSIRTGNNCSICAVGKDKVLCSICSMCDKKNHFVYRDLEGKNGLQK